MDNAIEGRRLSSAPEGWHLPSEFSLHTKHHPYEEYGLPSANVLLTKEDLYFAQCGDKFVIGNDISDGVSEVVEPKDLPNILLALPNEENLKFAANLKLAPLFTDETESLSSKENPKSPQCPTDWTDQRYKLVMVRSPFEELGLEPAQTVLLNEKTDDCIVKSKDKLFYWHWRSDVIEEILEPRTLRGICKYLSDSTPLHTKHLQPGVVEQC